ncbi:MAG: sigma-70 family RNA polymerase sigma factor [Candidatus Aminicenantia bacterium]
MEKSDRELVESALKGDNSSFEALVIRYQNGIINYIYRMILDMDEALDLAQEVFIKAFFSLNTYNPHYSFSTWIYKIASNLAIDFLRKRKRKNFNTESLTDKEREIEIPDNSLSPVSNFEKQMFYKKLEITLNQLPESLREFVILRDLNELSYNEISEIKNIPIGTVKNKIFRAREILRKLLEE